MTCKEDVVQRVLSILIKVMSAIRLCYVDLRFRSCNNILVAHARYSCSASLVPGAKEELLRFSRAPGTIEATAVHVGQ